MTSEFWTPPALVRHSLQVVYDSGEYCKLEGTMLPLEMVTTANKEMTARAKYTDIEVLEVGTVYDCRGADECEPWI